MRKVYLTFSGAAYDETTRLIVEQAPRFGADEVRVYDDAWLLRQDFYRQNKWLWDHPHKRGFGWYAWKPFIIWHALSMLTDGDVVLYTDADTYPIAPFGMLFDQCVKDGGLMFFASEHHRQAEWCKADCYVVMGQRIFEHLPHGVARFMLFQKGPWRSAQFLMEWLTYCVNPSATTFDPSIWSMPELPQFVEHRAEQAILTNLAHKYGCYLYREACEAGAGTPRDQDLYGQLFRQVHADISHITSDSVGSLFSNVDVCCA